jgi:TolB protein
MKTKIPQKIFVTPILVLASLMLLQGTSQSHAMCFREPLPGELNFNSSGARFELVPAIAFSSTRDNTALLPVAQGLEIYLTDLDGVSNLRRLTENLHQDTFPVISPDGKKIAFDSNRLRVTGEHINISDLWVMEADGSEQTVLLKRAGSSSWSPNSKNLVFHASASGTGVPTKGDIGAALSDSDIFMLNLDDCIDAVYGAWNITNTTDYIEDDPDWSPDGQRIAFTRRSVLDMGQDSETAEIWTMNPDGTDQQQVTFNNEEERAPAWSPDSTKICFMCRALWLNNGMDFEICVVNADGSGLVTLTDNLTPELGPQWTPDGQQIVFHRQIGAFNQIFIMNADGTNERQLTDLPAHSLFTNPGYVRVHSE